MKKIDIWKTACAEGEPGCFPQLASYLFNSAFDRTAIMKTVDTHLDKLKDEFHSYFPNIEEMSTSLNWIRNPFMVQSASIPVRLRESLADVSTDEGLKMKFSATTLTQFWCEVGREYPDLAEHAIKELLPFGSTYLCEVTFSAMAHIKTKQRNRLDLEKSLITAVATVSPRLTKLMSGKQAH
ncbi:hypothetical protein LDENG_00184840 [Lucifuga dentata]|nr:hypothetical protein LDENG_00184840 [Lucifuga dentata]